MWIDVLAVVVLSAFAAVGALRGALAGALALLTLVLAYAVAAWLGPPFAPHVTTFLGAPSLVGLPLAGTLVFLLAFAVGSGASGLARRAERRQRRGEPRTRSDRLLGAGLGGLRGSLVVLLLGLLAIWLDAFAGFEGAPRAPATDGSALTAVTERVVEVAASAVLADAGPTGRLAARTLARPAETLAAFEELVADPRIANLRGDRGFWSLVEGGQIDAALDRMSFAAVHWSPDLRAQFAELGLVEPRVADDPALFRAAWAEALGEAGPRLRALRDDPELARLAADPEVADLLASGDTLGLLRHAGVRRVLARVAAASG